MIPISEPLKCGLFPHVGVSTPRTLFTVRKGSENFGGNQTLSESGTFYIFFLVVCFIRQVFSSTTFTF